LGNKEAGIPVVMKEEQERGANEERKKPPLQRQNAVDISDEIKETIQKLVGLSEKMEEHKQKTAYKLFKCFNPIRKTAEYKEFKSIIGELESRKPYSECYGLSVRKYGCDTVSKAVSNLTDPINKTEKRYINTALSKERTKILGGVFRK
jgi:hypothetical protein